MAEKSINYYKLENTDLNWRKYIDLFGLEVFCDRFCNTTLCQIYRRIFFASDEEYTKNLMFYRSVRNQIEIVANQRKFDFFDIDPIEVEGKIITADSSQLNISGVDA